MTSFRQSSCSIVCLLLFCLLLTPPATAAPDPVAVESAQSLPQENADLKRKLRRLEHQVAALRDELNSPDVSQIFGGFGYIIGIFGIAGWVAARKRTGRED